MDGIIVKEGPVFLFRKGSKKEGKRTRTSPGRVRKWLLLVDDPATLRVFSADRSSPGAVEEGVLGLYNGYGVGVGHYGTVPSTSSTPGESQKVIHVSGMNQERQLTCRFIPDGDDALVEQWRLAIATVLATAPRAENDHPQKVQETDTSPSRLRGFFSVPSIFGRTAADIVLRRANKNLPLIIAAAFRMIWLIFCFGPLLIGIPVIYGLLKLVAWLVELWWAYALLAVECNGATFIKLGQWAASRRDLFPEEFCNRFGKLHSAAPSHPWKDTEKVLDLSYGPDWRTVLEVEEKPIGTGCVAQVHKGILKASGERVAVKVVHPGLHKSVELDLAVLMYIAKFFERMSPETEWLGLTDTATEFADLMNSQLDMRVEAENLKKLTKNFETNPQIKFPVPIEGYITELCLLESFEAGVPMADFIRRGDERMKKRLARTGLAAFMQMIFLDNFAHADLHPGNVLVAGDWEDDEPLSPTNYDENSLARKSVAGTVVVAVADSVVSVAQTVHGTVSKMLTKKKGYLIFLDGGLALQLHNTDRKNFVDIFYSVCMGEGEKCANLMLERCKQHDCKDPQAFTDEVAELIRSSPTQVSDLNVGEVIGSLMDTCKNHRVKHFSSFTSVLLATAVMEGVGRSLDPDLDVLMTSLPYVMEARTRVLMDPVLDDGDTSTGSCATS